MPGDSTPKPLCYRGAKEICIAIGEDHKKLCTLVEKEGLPAFRRNGKGTWRALETDLVQWLEIQRDKYAPKKTCQ